MKSKVALLCKTDRVMHLEFLHLKEIWTEWTAKQSTFYTLSRYYNDNDNNTE